MKHLFKTLIFFFFALTFNITSAQNVKTYIHPDAVRLMPTVKYEVDKFLPELSKPWYFPGLIEHESCILLKHSRCWNAKSRLKNNREEGAGLFQITRAWDNKGKLRFDNVTYLSKKYVTHLNGLNWNTIYDREDLQLRAGVLLYMEGYNRFTDLPHNDERIKMADSVFNGGYNHVKVARQRCAVLTKCNPSIWFNNVELHLPKSRVPDSRYGGKSMYDINVRHVRDVFNNRMAKFKPYWEN